MFPPKAPGVAVLIASFLAGAVATQPSMGFRGNSRGPGLRPVMLVRATPLALSIVQVSTLGSRSPVRRNMGSTAYGATRVFEVAVALLGSSRWKVTFSMSPGSAPSMKNGPVWGLGPGIGLPDA